MTTHVTPSDASVAAVGEGRYARLARLIATDQPVIMDGATGTELIRVRGERPELEDHLWGLTAILEAPADVKAVHRHYVEVGCDVISTDTWGLATALRDGRANLWESTEPIHWMDLARRGVHLAREAAADAGRADEVAVAFSINGDVDTPDGRETIRLLARAFEHDAPDLILVETLTLIRSSTYATVEALLDTGLPVWLSFRRCRHGVCGVYGEHWGGPEGDAFGRAAPPLRGDGRRRARAQLPAAGSRHRDAGVAARLHRSTARRVSQPRVSVGRRLAPGGGRGRRGIRRARTPAGARRARRSSAAAVASGRSRSRLPAPRSPAPSRATPARPRCSTKAPGRSRQPSANARP